MGALFRAVTDEKHEAERHEKTGIQHSVIHENKVNLVTMVNKVRHALKF